MPRFGPLVSQREFDRTGREKNQAPSDDRGNRPDPTDDSISLGSLMRGLGGVNEAPVRSDEELQSRAQRNAGFLQQPEIQAAMMQFAVSIMQPLGSGAGWGDFAGAFGNAVGAGVQGAGTYQLVQQEEEDRLLNQDLKEREMTVREKGLTLDERRLEAEEEESLLGQDLKEREMVVREKGLSLNERELEEKIKAGKLKQRSVMINGASPINDMFDLGMASGERAKVLVTYDENGEVVQADLEDLEEGNNTTESTVAKLQREADEAEARGDMAKANQLRQAASKEATGESTVNIEKGIGLTPDPNAASGVRVIELEGGAAEQARIEADEKEALGKQEQLGKALVINSTVDNIHRTLADSIAPDLLITGGVGGLSALMPHPTDARIVEQWLETIRATIGFDELRKMREASPTGGALGQVAIQENIWLQSLQGSLFRTQKSEELVKQLLTLKYLYDPSKVEWRSGLSKQVEDGTMTNDEALAAMQTDLMEFVYPDLKPEPFNLDAAPDYVSDEDKRLWEHYTPEQKRLFLNEQDRTRANEGFN